MCCACLSISASPMPWEQPRSDYLSPGRRPRPPPARRWSGAALGPSKRCAAALRPRARAHSAPSSASLTTTVRLELTHRYRYARRGARRRLRPDRARPLRRCRCRRRRHRPHWRPSEPRSAAPGEPSDGPEDPDPGGGCAEPPAAQRCPRAASAGLAPAWRVPAPMPAPTPPSAVYVGRPHFVKV